MRSLIVAVLFLNFSFFTSNVQGFGGDFSFSFHPEENVKRHSTELLHTIPKFEAFSEALTIVHDIWTITQELFKSLVVEIESKTTGISQHEMKLLSFFKNKFNLFNLKFGHLQTGGQDHQQRIEYLIPLLKRLKAFFRSKSSEKAAESNILEYYSFAYKTVGEILKILEENCSNLTVFSTTNEAEEFKILLSGNFKVKVGEQNLQLIYEKLKALKARRSSIRDVVAAVKTNIVSGSSILAGLRNDIRIAYNIWTSLQKLFDFTVYTIQKKTDTLSEFETEIIYFHDNHYHFISVELEKLLTNKYSYQERIKFMIPILKRLNNFLSFRTQTKISSDAHLNEFYSDAHKIVSEILSIFATHCLDKTIFSVQDYNQEIKLISDSKMFINLQEKTLEQIYKKLSSLEQKLSKIEQFSHLSSATKLNDFVKTSLLPTSNDVEFQVLLDIWTLTREFIQALINNIEKKTTVLLKNEIQMIKFYKNYYNRFASELNKLDDKNFQKRIKFLIPLLSHLKRFFYSQSRVNFLHQSTLTEFESYAYKSISEILAILEVKCSDKTIFSITDIEQELNIVSNTNIYVSITKSDLNKIYSNLKILSDRLSKLVLHSVGAVVPIKQKVVPGQTLLSSSTENSVTSLKIWTLTQEIVQSVVFSIRSKATTALLESETKFLSFCRDGYPLFALKLNEFGKNLAIHRGGLKYLIPILKHLKTFFLALSQLKNSQTIRLDSSVVKFYFSAYGSVSKILKILQSSTANSYIFSAKSTEKELEIINSDFVISIKDSDLNAIYENLKVIREKQASLTSSSEVSEQRLTTTTSVSASSDKYLATSVNVWALINKLLDTVVRTIETKTTNLIECETIILNFYKQYYQTFVTKFDELRTGKSNQNSIKFLIPILKRLRTYFYSVPKMKDRNSSTEVVNLVKFHSYAFNTVSNILEIFKQSCSDQSILTTEDYSEEMKILSKADFAINIQERDLNKVYSGIQGVMKKLSNIGYYSTHLTHGRSGTRLLKLELNDAKNAAIEAQHGQAFGTSQSVWILINELVNTLVKRLESKSTTLLEYEASFLKYYEKYYKSFASKLREIGLEKINSHSRIKFLIPILKRLTTFFDSLAKTKSSTSSNLVEFYSLAQRTVTEVLSIFERTCSNKSIFTVENYEKEIELISNSNFVVNVEENDLRIILEKLRTLRMKQLDLVGYAGEVHITTKLSNPISSRNVGTPLNIWLLTQKIILSLIDTIEKSKSVVLKCDARFLRFYKNYYQFFASKLNQLRQLKSSSPSNFKYIIPVFKRLNTYFYDASREKNSAISAGRTELYSYAYKIITEILRLFEKGCSNKAVFSSASYTQEMEILSDKEFVFSIQEEDLKLIYEKLADFIAKYEPTHSSSTIEVPTSGATIPTKGTQNYEPTAGSKDAVKFPATRRTVPTKGTQNYKPTEGGSADAVNFPTARKASLTKGTQKYAVQNGPSSRTFDQLIYDYFQTLEGLYRNKLGISTNGHNDKFHGSSSISKNHQSTVQVALIDYLKLIESFHKRSVDSPTESVASHSQNWQFDRKIQEVLFQTIEEFLRWKTRVADFCSANNLSEACVTTCMLGH